MIADFWDHGAGGFFFQAAHDKPVLVRQKVYLESALPSGNAVAYHTLRELNTLTGTDRYSRFLDKSESAAAPLIKKNPGAGSFFLGAFLRLHARSALVTIAGRRNDPSTHTMIQAVAERFLPYTTVRIYTGDGQDRDLERLMPGIGSHAMINDRATAYVCTNGTCHPPTTDCAEMLDHLMQGSA
jgi:hypothetical protein